MKKRRNLRRKEIAKTIRRSRMANKMGGIIKATHQVIAVAIHQTNRPQRAAKNGHKIETELK